MVNTDVKIKYLRKQDISYIVDVFVCFRPLHGFTQVPLEHLGNSEHLQSIATANGLVQL